MTLDARGINSPNDVGKLFTNIKPFNIDDHPFVKQRSMTYRIAGKTKDIYLQGPTRYTKTIKTIDDDWTVSGLNLNGVKQNLIKAGIYGIFTVMPNEGATVWALAPDSQWSSKGEEGIEDFAAIIDKDIKGRKWASAFNTAKNALEDKQNSAPFSPLFFATVTVQEDGIPFFGRVAWGIAEANGIISLTQIPLMNPSNRKDYFTWSFVSKAPITENDLYSAYGKGGGEQDYSRFTKFRDFVIKECVPLDPKGDYKDLATGNEKPINKDDSAAQPKPGKAPNTQGTQTSSSSEQGGENPLTQASKEINGESLYRSIEKSLLVAESFITFNNYRLINEGGLFGDENENDPDYVGKTDDQGNEVESDKAILPSGDPYINKLKTNNDGVPLLGPIY